MFLNISENAFLESFDAGKDAAPELILGQVAEESFDHVEPTAAGGREVEMKALVARSPAQNRRVFVGGIVVDDQVELFVGGRLAGTSAILDGDDAPCKWPPHCRRGC
jgi:hypothetical protein